MTTITIELKMKIFKTLGAVLLLASTLMFSACNQKKGWSEGLDKQSYGTIWLIIDHSDTKYLNQAKSIDQPQDVKYP